MSSRTNDACIPFCRLGKCFCTSAAKSRIHGELSIAALEALRHPKPGSCDGDKSTTTRDLKCPPWPLSESACRTQMLWRKSLYQAPLAGACIRCVRPCGRRAAPRRCRTLFPRRFAPANGNPQRSHPELHPELHRAGGSHYLSVRDATQPMAASLNLIEGSQRAASSHNGSSGTQESWVHLRSQPILQPYRRID